MDTKLYPIKFQPILKETIWGGNQIASFFSREQNPSILTCGESWEVSAVPNNISIAQNGPLKRIPLDVICRRYTKNFLGLACEKNKDINFSLLIKYLSTKNWLSVQVHPNQQSAALIPNAKGKAELWIILDAQPDSSIYLGIQPQWINKSPLDLLNKGKNIIHCLQQYNVKSGDIFFIPPGQIHAMGKNILALEIQQSSDTTYRIFDWERSRPLQKENALLSISLEPPTYPFQISINDSYKSISPLFSCEYFACNKLFCSKQFPLSRNLSKWDHFVIWSHIQGGTIDLIYDQSACVRLRKGDTVVIPACIEEILLLPKDQDCVLIESYIPQSPFAFDI